LPTFRNGVLDKKLLDLQSELIRINQTHFQNSNPAQIIQTDKIIMLTQEMEIVKKKVAPPLII
jgi:hypothetical protein